MGPRRKVPIAGPADDWGKVFHQTHWAPLLQMQRSVAEVKLDIVHRSGTIVPMVINATRQCYGDDEFDDFALLVVADRHKYERELLRTRQQAEAALKAKLAAQKRALITDDSVCVGRMGRDGAASPCAVSHPRWRAGATWFARRAPAPFGRTGRLRTLPRLLPCGGILYPSTALCSAVSSLRIRRCCREPVLRLHALLQPHP
ncbi:Phosphoserine phosphatase RsbP [Caballeronia humi]|uniref:Phosphoserine phosphatase RsbP n=1 Tax=Caballeronia humi TaxID=326474 RepID=A0A158JMV7_9BURK|nr:Phosphoserine phosphatase RsbP [Caballeronia humi]